MIGIKRIVWLLALAALLVAGIIKLAVAEDELTTLLLASAQVGASEATSENSPQQTINSEIPKPEATAEADTPPEPAQPPVSTETPMIEKEAELVENQTPLVEEIKESDMEEKILEADSEIPALPAPVAQPDTTVAIGEPMKKKNNYKNQQRMDAIEALKYLLGDLDKLEKQNKLKGNQTETLGTKYLVAPGDTLDVIIEKTMVGIPIRKGILRRAFVETNKHAFPSDSPHRLLAGMYIKIPNVGDIRDIIFPKGLPRELEPELVVDKKLNSKTRNDWVRYP